jgi:hypothetical protein
MLAGGGGRSTPKIPKERDKIRATASSMKRISGTVKNGPVNKAAKPYPARANAMPKKIMPGYEDMKPMKMPEFKTALKKQVPAQYHSSIDKAASNIMTEYKKQRAITTKSRINGS